MRGGLNEIIHEKHLLAQYWAVHQTWAVILKSGTQTLRRLALALGLAWVGYRVKISGEQECDIPGLRNRGKKTRPPDFLWSLQ